MDCGIINNVPKCNSDTGKLYLYARVRGRRVPLTKQVWDRIGAEILRLDQKVAGKRLTYRIKNIAATTMTYQVEGKSPKSMRISGVFRQIYTLPNDNDDPDFNVDAKRPHSMSLVSSSYSLSDDDDDEDDNYNLYRSLTNSTESVALGNIRNDDDDDSDSSTGPVQISENYNRVDQREILISSRPLTDDDSNSSTGPVQRPDPRESLTSSSSDSSSESL